MIFGIISHIKLREKISFISLELLSQIIAFIIIFAYWNNNLASRIGYLIIPMAIFFIGWQIYAGLKANKKHGLDEMGGLGKETLIFSFILMSPIIYFSVKLILNVLNIKPT